MMEEFFVYILYAEKFDKIYIGQTADLDERLRHHNHAEVNSFTSRYRPWVLVYKERCYSRADAMKREKQLKSGNGRIFAREQVRRFISG